MNYNNIIELVKSTKSIIDGTLKEQYHTKMKGQSDFVTSVDISISDYLKKELKNIDPSIGFFCEEESGGLSDPCWILDPIDGTTNLVYSYNLSSVSLGLYAEGQIQFGVVYNPFTDECFTAQKGCGAYLNGKKLQVSDRDVSQSIVEFGAGSTHKEYADANFAIAKEVFMRCIDIRRICSSALDLCYIADSRIDGYFEIVLKPWDIAAGSLILSEAGGKITDYLGEDVSFEGKTSVIASNGVIHGFLQETVEKHMGNML